MRGRWRKVERLEKVHDVNGAAVTFQAEAGETVTCVCNNRQEGTALAWSMMIILDGEAPDSQGRR
ncbi:MAG: hypothetical protein SWE60_17490 [Thermodesulfobacteriota bacterium]|nr:hypothetical protein [Thermodesulfobacteriota bacterium]